MLEKDLTYPNESSCLQAIASRLGANITLVEANVLLEATPQLLDRVEAYMELPFLESDSAEQAIGQELCDLVERFGVPMEVVGIDVDEAAQFQRYHDAWINDFSRIVSSSILPTIEHPGYQAIIAMGERALPYILAALEKETQWYMYALEQIVLKSKYSGPVYPSQYEGRLDKLTEIWTQWGKENSILK